MLNKGRHAISRRVSRGWAIPVSMMLVIGLMGTALGAVTFDPETGTGFVGKGDVQTAFGWNNKQLQQNAEDVTFSVESVTATETEWTCKRDDGVQTQERTRTTETTTSGLFSHVERVKNQITGFTLTGFSGDVETETETEGPAVGSCPAQWSVIEGPTTSDPEVISGGVFAHYGGTDVPLP
jgi:hypothetical protein